jgi:GTP cyclohydrolase I
VNKPAEHYAAILQETGADLHSEGVPESPMRAAKALVEMTEGSRMDADALTKPFKAECQEAVCHEMVIVQRIHQVGVCEHHVLPIDGTQLCARAVGVRDTRSVMKVNVMHGVFQTDPEVRREFLLRRERR